MLLFFRNAVTGFGGNNGLTDFKRSPRLLPLRASRPRAPRLCAISAAGLAAAYVICRQRLRHPRAGRVLTAIRDVEAKVRFSGYSIRFATSVFRLDALPPCFAGWPARSTCRRSVSSNPSEMQPLEPPVEVAHMGRRRRARHPCGCHGSARSWSTGPRVGSTAGLPLACLLLSWGSLLVLVTLLLPGGNDLKPSPRSRVSDDSRREPHVRQRTLWGASFRYRPRPSP